MIDAAKLIEIARGQQEQSAPAPIAPPAPAPVVAPISPFSSGAPAKQYPLGNK